MLILDGGIGAEMDKRINKASKDPTWCGRYHLTHSTLLHSVYEDFVKNGATILSANTYSILQYLTNESDEQIDYSVKEAIALVNRIKKSNHNLSVAGCISAHASQDATFASVQQSLSLLVSCIVKYGVDFLLVEMIQTEDIGKLMISTADSANLPVILGFSIVTNDNKLTLKDEDTDFDKEFVQRMINGCKHVVGIGVMHSSIDVMDASLYVIEEVWSGNLILYPDTGVFENNQWKCTHSNHESIEIVKKLKKIKENHPNLYIVGGCCGLGPSYIHQLAEEFENFVLK